MRMKTQSRPRRSRGLLRHGRPRPYRTLTAAFGLTFLLLGILAVPLATAAKPNKPTNPSPSNGATNQEITITLTWTATDPDGDELAHTVYFGTSSNPSSSPPGCSSLATPSCTVSDLTYSTTYYWRVKVTDDTLAYTIGDTWNFATRPPPTNNPPNKATNPVPENLATGVDISQKLYWTSGGDPDGNTVTFNVYFGTSSPPPQGPSWCQGLSEAGCDPTGSALEYSTTYFWRVDARDSFGAIRTGDLWTFTTIRFNSEPWQPSNPSPATGATSTSTSFTLAWSGGADPENDPVTFNVYLSTTNPPPLTATLCENRTVKNCATGTLVESTWYYWRVQAVDSLGADSWSPTWSFMTNTPPNTPSAPLPATGSTNQPVPLTLQWSGGDADGTSPTYTVYVDPSNPPSRATSKCTTTTPSCHVTDLSTASTYYWQVSSSDGRTTREGPVWSFTTYNRDPNAPSNPSPSDGATNQPTTVVLSWLASDPEGQSLTYQVEGGPTGSPAGGICVTSAPSCTWPGLSRGVTYSWYVIAVDSWGGYTTSPTWRFTTRPNQVPAACFTTSQLHLTVSANAACSSDADGDALSYEWDWGDGTTAAGQSATHTYNVCPSGSFTIALAATDGYDGTGTAARSVTVADMRDSDQDGLAYCRERGQGTSDEDSDSDDDGLTDDVESLWWALREDVFCPPGAVRPCVDYPNPLRMDIYVEVDWYTGHALFPQNVQNVVSQYANSPPRILLHLDVGQMGGGEELGSGPYGNGNAAEADVDSNHRNHLAAVRQPYFHYVTVACYDPADLTRTSGGWGDTPGVVVAIYDCVAQDTGPHGFAQAVVLMQELGHNVLGWHYEPAAARDGPCALYLQLRNPNLGHFWHDHDSRNCDRSPGPDAWSHSGDPSDDMYGGWPMTRIGFTDATWWAIRPDMAVGPNSRACVSPVPWTLARNLAGLAPGCIAHVGGDEEPIRVPFQFPDGAVKDPTEWSGGGLVLFALSFLGIARVRPRSRG